MAIPAPDLDDRRFQELVDDAKRFVMQRCPEWTDHNVSDPGVTLIETFAHMTDTLLYRLNRVPDRLYIKFLELMGLQLFPATSARTGVTFWLSGPATAPLTIPQNTRVATRRTDVDDALVFSTAAALPIVPVALAKVLTRRPHRDSDGTPNGVAIDDHTEELRLERSFAAFDTTPSPGDELLFGLDAAAPSNCVRFMLRCRIEGVGVDPDDPPLRWEAWNGDGWSRCESGTDQTGGLNRDGYIDVHVPDDHTISVIDGARGGWIRAVVSDPEPGLPAYTTSPQIHGAVAASVGGTVDALHAELVERETIGESEGVPGQTFQLHRKPVVAAGPERRLVVSTDDGWQRWSEVDHFADSSGDDLHYLFDEVSGAIHFGPAVRNLDGHLAQFGAIPPKGAFIQMEAYATGGGRKGNVSKGALATMRSSIPFVAAVENRHAASGGVDPETLDSAKQRGPILLRTRGRAVTAEDFEALTREAAPEIARVRCVPVQNSADAGSIKVLVVPATATPGSGTRFEGLVPSTDTLERITARLDRARMVGTRVLIEPPSYQAVTVVAELSAAPRANTARIRDEAVARLHRYFDPITGGPTGDGWPWGRPVQAGEAYLALAGIDGVDLVQQLRLFGANPVTGERGAATDRLELAPNSLVFSFEHQIRVSES
jgi:predicted phage baseplate assembly protein